MIGEAYRAQKLSCGGDRRSEEFSKHQNGVLKGKLSAAKVIAKKFGVGSSTVDRANWFVESLDATEVVFEGFEERRSFRQQ